MPNKRIEDYIKQHLTDNPDSFISLINSFNKLETPIVVVNSNWQISFSNTIFNKHLGEKNILNLNSLNSLFNFNEIKNTIINIQTKDNKVAFKIDQFRSLGVFKLYSHNINFNHSSYFIFFGSKESETNLSKHKLLVDQLGFGYGYFTSKGEIIALNKIAAQNMGGKPEDFTGKNLFDLFPQDIAKEFLDRIEKCIKTCKSYHYTDKVNLPSGYKWFKSICSIAKDPQDDIIGVQIVSDDITHEKKLEKRNATLSRAIDKSLNGFCIINDNFKFTFANSTYLNMWGYDHLNEIYDQTPESHCENSSDACKIKEEVDKLGVYTTDFIAKRKDGSLFDARIYIRKETDEDGKTIYPASAIDISERQLAINNFQESETKFRAFIDHAGDGAVILDEQAKVSFVNDAFCKILNLKKSEILDSYGWDLIFAMSTKPSKNENFREQLKQRILHLLKSNDSIDASKNQSIISQNKTNKPIDVIESVFVFSTNKGKNIGVFLRDISDIVQTEKEMQSAYELLSETEKIAKSGSWTYNPLTNEGSWSKGSYKIRGASADLVGNSKNHENFMHPDDIESYRKKFQENLNSNKNEFKQYYRLIDSHKNLKHIEAHYEIQRDKKGKATFITGIDKDITELYNTKTELEISENRFKLAMNASKDGLFDWNLKTNKIYYSPGWKKMLGYEDNELPNEFSIWEKLTHNEDVKESWKRLQAHIAGETDRFEIEFRMKHKAGHYVDILSRANAFFNEEGKAIRVVGTHVDITESKKAKFKLEYQKKLTQQYLDVSGTIMIALDPEQNVVLINPKGCQVLEYEKEEIIGKNWFDHFLPRENIEDVKNVFNQVISGNLEQVEYYENAIITKNGEEKIIAWHNSIVKDEKGKIIRLFSSGNDITEEIKNKKALEQSEETIRLALASGNQGLYDLNLISGEAQINDNYALLLGYKPESFTETKDSWENKLHPDDRDRTIQAYNQYINGEIPEYSVEFRLKTADNNWKWILSYGKIVEYNEDGKPIRMIGTHTDIDELKIAQEKIIDSEEKYKALYMNAPLAYQSLHITGRIIDVNPQWLKTLGYERDEVIGKYFGDFLNSESKEHFKKKFPVFKARGQVSDVRFHMITKSGDQIVVSFEGCIGYTKTGQFRQTYCTFKDISSEVIANQMLHDASKTIEVSERKFRELFEKSGDAVFILEGNKIVNGNPASVELFGFESFEELQRKMPSELSPEYQENNQSSQELMNIVIEEAIKNGTNRFEWIHKNKNNKNFPAEILLTYLGKNEEGQLMTHAVMRDITNRKNKELELIKAKNKAEESDRLKSAFLANMSHEIRTPMNGILGFAELLKEPQLDDEEIKQYVEVIERGGKRMLNIINDLIDISKIEARQMELVMDETNINVQINYLKTFFNPEAQKKNVELKIHTPLSNEKATIFSDREKIYAILTNLIKNAVKYTKEGFIDFGYKDKDNYLEFYVKDTGVGIPIEKQPTIFERFVQADMAHNREFEGAGLGLAIARAYVEMLGGKIWIEKSNEEGTEFKFTIPK